MLTGNLCDHLGKFSFVCDAQNCKKPLSDEKAVDLSIANCPLVQYLWLPEKGVLWLGTVPCRWLSICVSSQTPSFYTFRGRGLWYAQADRETVEVSNYRAGTSKLSQYRSLEQSLKTVEHIEHIEKLSRYRTIEQGLENCRKIGHSSIVQCGGESHHMQ